MGDVVALRICTQHVSVERRCGLLNDREGGQLSPGRAGLQHDRAGGAGQVVGHRPVERGHHRRELNPAQQLIRQGDVLGGERATRSYLQLCCGHAHLAPQSGFDVGREVQPVVDVRPAIAAALLQLRGDLRPDEPQHLRAVRRARLYHRRCAFRHRELAGQRITHEDQPVVAAEAQVVLKQGRLSPGNAGHQTGDGFGHIGATEHVGLLLGAERCVLPTAGRPSAPQPVEQRPQCVFLCHLTCLRSCPYAGWPVYCALILRSIAVR